MRGTSSLPSLVPVGYALDGLSLTFFFVFNVMVLTIDFYWIFCLGIGSKANSYHIVV